MDISILALWNAMGWFARGIIIVLVAMSIGVVSVALAKWWKLRKSALATRQFSSRFSEALEGEKVEEALQLSKRYEESHVARVLGEALRGVTTLLAKPGRSEQAADAAERAVEREQILLATELKGGLGSLATIAATAPFLGLLGTVIGITNSFIGIARTGGGGIEAIAVGIGEALFTTAVGLVVAIPAVWVYNYFTGRLEQIFSELAYAGRELVDWMIRRGQADFPERPPAGPQPEMVVDS